MKTHLVFELRFQAPQYYGTDQNKQQEWPPAWWRVFCGLMSSCVSMRNDEYSHAISQQFAKMEEDGEVTPTPRFDMERHRPFMSFLESLPPPMIIAVPTPPFRPGVFDFVPNNDISTDDDTVKKHRLVDMEYARINKPIPFTIFPKSKQGNMVTYAFDITGRSLPDGFAEWVGHAAAILQCVGTGKDIVMGRGSIVKGWEPDLSAGRVRWEMRQATVNQKSSLLYRSRKPHYLQLVPREGTYDELQDIYHMWEQGEYRKTPISATWMCPRLADDRKDQPWVAFQLLDPARPQSFAHLGLEEAFYVAHSSASAVYNRVRDEPLFDNASLYVLGKRAESLSKILKDEKKTEAEKAFAIASNQARLSFLPIPTVDGFRGLGDIRRLIVTAPPEDEEQVLWMANYLDGLFVQFNGKPRFVLSTICHSRSKQIPGGHSLLRRYVGMHTSWCTVTPSILPGSPGRKTKTLFRGKDPITGEGVDPITEKCMVRRGNEFVEVERCVAVPNSAYWDKLQSMCLRSITDAGVPEASVVATHASQEGRVSGGLRPGAFVAWPKKGPNARHVGRMLSHVHMELASPLQGPLAIGCGRHSYGMGVMIASE